MKKVEQWLRRSRSFVRTGLCSPQKIRYFSPIWSCVDWMLSDVDNHSSGRAPSERNSRHAETAESTTLKSDLCSLMYLWCCNQIKGEHENTQWVNLLSSSVLMLLFQGVLNLTWTLMYICCYRELLFKKLFWQRFMNFLQYLEPVLSRTLQCYRVN